MDGDHDGNGELFQLTIADNVQLAARTNNYSWRPQD